MIPGPRIAWLAVLCCFITSCGAKAPATPVTAADLAYYSTYANSLTDPIGGLATLYSVDWAGQPHPTIRLREPAGVGPKYGPAPRIVGSVSLDGSRLLISDGDVLDGSGRKLGRIDPTLGFGPRWAQDDKHLCELTVPGYRSFKGGTLQGPVSLLWVGLDTTAKNVAVVGSAGLGYWVEVAACNSAADRAVLIQSTIAAPPNASAQFAITVAKELTVVRLSTGALLYRHAYPISTNPPGGTIVTVSDDGAEVAESLAYLTYPAVPPPTSAPNAVIRALPSGDQIGSIRGTVAMFSGDDSMVLTTTRLAENGYQSQLVNWRTGAIAWQRPTGFQFLITHTGSRAFLVVESETLWLIRDDGTWQRIATGVDALYSVDRG